jgi:hypothetical protein
VVAFVVDDGVDEGELRLHVDSKPTAATANNARLLTSWYGRCGQVAPGQRCPSGRGYNGSGASARSRFNGANHRSGEQRGVRLAPNDGCLRRQFLDTGVVVRWVVDGCMMLRVGSLVVAIGVAGSVLAVIWIGRVVSRPGGQALRAGFVAIVVVTVASGCSSSSKPTSSATTTSKPRPVARLAPTSFGELAREIITRVPPGFDVGTGNTGDMGPADLATASKSDSMPNAREVLAAEGFVRRYARNWVGPGHAQIVVIINQFRSKAGAASDYEQRASDNRARPQPGSHPFVVAGLPRDQALGATARGSESGAVAEILFTTGVYVVQLVCNGPDSETTMARRVTSLAVAQFERLGE